MRCSVQQELPKGLRLAGVGPALPWCLMSTSERHENKPAIQDLKPGELSEHAWGLLHAPNEALS